MKKYAKELLKEYEACSEAIDWAADRTVKEAWDECERGDWLIWFYGRIYPENLREITLSKGHCANTVRHLMKDKRSLASVDAAIAFGNGLISKDELKNAAYFASSDYYSDAAAAYAADAAYFASSDYYSDASAASAADAAYFSSSDYYSSAAAKKQNQKLTSDICRRYLTISELKADSKGHLND